MIDYGNHVASSLVEGKATLEARVDELYKIVGSMAGVIASLTASAEKFQARLDSISVGGTAEKAGNTPGAAELKGKGKPVEGSLRAAEEAAVGDKEIDYEVKDKGKPEEGSLCVAYKAGEDKEMGYDHFGGFAALASLGADHVLSGSEEFDFDEHNAQWLDAVLNAEATKDLMKEQEAYEEVQSGEAWHPVDFLHEALEKTLMSMARIQSVLQASGGMKEATCIQLQLECQSIGNACLANVSGTSNDEGFVEQLQVKVLDLMRAAGELSDKTGEYIKSRENVQEKRNIEEEAHSDKDMGEEEVEKTSKFDEEANGKGKPENGFAAARNEEKSESNSCMRSARVRHGHEIVQFDNQ